MLAITRMKKLGFEGSSIPSSFHHAPSQRELLAFMKQLGTTLLDPCRWGGGWRGTIWGKLGVSEGGGGRPVAPIYKTLLLPISRPTWLGKKQRLPASSNLGQACHNLRIEIS